MPLRRFVLVSVAVMLIACNAIFDMPPGTLDPSGASSATSSSSVGGGSQGSSGGAECESADDCASEECRVPNCTLNLCGSSGVPDGTPCSDDRTCRAGVCTCGEPTVECRDGEAWTCTPEGSWLREPCTIACDSGCVRPVVLGAGSASTCALLSDGSVRCWGSNFAGQLGNGESGDAVVVPPVVASLPQETSALAVGSAFACAQTGAEIWCWGGDFSGELGNGAAGASPLPAPITIVGPQSPIAAGGSHGCAAGDGTALCWGANAAKQVSFGYAELEAQSPQFSGLAFSPAQLALGSAHSCALDVDESVWCWGANAEGQLGSDVPGPLAPTQVSRLTDVTRVAAGAKHTCAVSAGEVWCWGANARGQVGQPAAPAIFEPMPVSGLPEAVDVCGGSAHTCAVTAGGVYCWGDNDSRQLGPLVDGVSSSPTAAFVPGLEGATSISCRHEHTCAILGQEVLCWGLNSNLQLGAAAPDPSAEPVAVSW